MKTNPWAGTSYYKVVSGRQILQNKVLIWLNWWLLKNCRPCFCFVSFAQSLNWSSHFLHVYLEPYLSTGRAGPGRAGPRFSLLSTGPNGPYFYLNKTVTLTNAEKDSLKLIQMKHVVLGHHSFNSTEEPGLVALLQGMVDFTKFTKFVVFLLKKQQRASTGRYLINSLFIGPPTSSTWIISGRAGPGWAGPQLWRPVDKSA